MSNPDANEMKRIAALGRTLWPNNGAFSDMCRKVEKMSVSMNHALRLLAQEKAERMRRELAEVEEFLGRRNYQDEMNHVVDDIESQLLRLYREAARLDP